MPAMPLLVFKKGQVIYWANERGEIFEGSIAAFVAWHGTVCCVVRRDDVREDAIPLQITSPTREGALALCFQNSVRQAGAAQFTKGEISHV